MRFGKLDPTLSPKQAKVGGTASSKANLRSSATTDSIVLQQLPVGTRVEIVTQNVGKAVSGDTVWFYVLSDSGASGYMHNSVLEPIVSSGNTTNGAGSLTTTTPEWLLPAIVVGGLALFLMGKK